MPRLLRRIETIVARRAPAFGGKAKNLAVLARAGFPVPAAYALSTDAAQVFFEEVLSPNQQPEALVRGARAPTEPDLAAIADRIHSSPMPARVGRAISDAWITLSSEGAGRLAVRSSSTHEDQEGASAAGMYPTILNVRSEGALLDAVRTCWAGLFTPTAMAYLRGLGGSPSVGMGVVIQALVPADVAGVMFSINPLTGDADEMVINAAYGLGSAVVDGRVSPDTFLIDKATRMATDRIIGDKSIRVILDEAEVVRDQEVRPDERAALCLDESTLDALIRLGIRIEEHFGGPRDIEWAVLNGVVYILQARAITAIHAIGAKRPSRRRSSRGDRSRIVWSNVNVGEALPGPATPVTWSVASSFSELGFRRAFGALGCSVPKDAELVGNFRGRIYLNLSEFMAIASQVPGLRPKTLLAFGGGGEADRLEAEMEHRSRLGFMARLPLTAGRFARENFRLRERVAEFERMFDEERRRIGSLDMRLLSPLALDRTLRDVERLLDESGAIMLTCYGNLLSSAVLFHAVLRQVAKDGADRLERDLFTGLADVDSAAPGMALWHIAEIARTEPTIASQLLQSDASELKVSSLPAGPTRRALENFLQAFGHRGVGEAELAQPRWRENPSLLFTTLQIHLSRPAAGERPIDVERRLRRVREGALQELESLLPPVGRAAVRHLIALVQRFTRLRERLRGYVVEVLGMFRRIAVDASRRIQQKEPEAGSDAAFFLHASELHAVLRRDLRRVASIIRPRRLQYLHDCTMPSPPDTFVGSPPPAASITETSVDELAGLAASAGVVEGAARVLHSSNDAQCFQAGEILVTASADVGWSPLFLVAGAVVTDLGGQLSHASVVLREYGVPAVVNVKVGTRVIQTGDLVQVDGDAGRVRILERRSSMDTDSGVLRDEVR